MGMVVGFGAKNVKNYDPTGLLVVAVWGLACCVVGSPWWCWFPWVGRMGCPGAGW